VVNETTQREPMIIVSACLAGVRTVNYPSFPNDDAVVRQLVADGRALPVCPEQMGGLPTPRPPAGFWGGKAHGFWGGASRVVTRVVSTEGDDYSEAFLRGCQEVLRLAQLTGAVRAILSDGSPTCGVTRTSYYSDTGNLVHGPGCGALTWLLRENGLEVYTPASWREAFGGAEPSK
jgi:uncharacterized protein YbbK (DUF523 family)